MAVKTIVRYKPPNELVGQRALTVADMRRIGIFTQEKDLYWNAENGFWLDAEEAGIAPEVMELLSTNNFSNDHLGHFTVEKQDVPDEPSEDNKPDEPVLASAADEGEGVSAPSPASAAPRTTTSKGTKS